ncbi:MAG: AlpA family phage regulatory protein [Burkholderiaceae bacterium]
MQQTSDESLGVSRDLSPPIFLRVQSVVRMTGLARSTIYEMMAEERFPRQVRIGARAVAWRRADIFEWSKGR